MTWLWIVGGLLALVVGVPMVVGRFLPADYHGRAVAVYAAPPSAVWAALVDHRATPVTGRQWKGTEDLAPRDGLPVWVEDMGESKVTVRTVVRDTEERLVRELTDSVVPMTARVELTLEPDGEGTRVTGVNHMEIRDGTWHVPVFRFLMTVTGGADRSLREYLGAIGGALGTEPTLE